jgi:hypothetical protein
LLYFVSYRDKESCVGVFVRFRFVRRVR